MLPRTFRRSGVCGEEYLLIYYEMDGNELADTCGDTEDEAFRQAMIGVEQQ